MRIWDLDSGDWCCNNLIGICDLDTGECVDISIPPQARIIKGGTLSPDDFSGTPLLATVSFDNDFSDTTYVISLAGEDARLFTYQSKTVSGFVINANSDTELEGEVSWTATVAGETS